MSFEAHSRLEGMAGPSIAWPRLERPSSPLELTQLDEGLFTVSRTLRSQECQAIADAARDLLVPTNPRNLPPPKGEAFRNNERVLIRDEAFATVLFDHIRGPLSCVVREDGASPVALNPNFRIYRYHKGQRFGAHIDEPVEVEDRRLQSEFTLLLYLNGGEGSWGAPLKGGETLFHVRKKGPPLSVSPSMGLLLLHWTGHDFLHEGSQVLNGEKWLLRTDVFFPKPQPQARGGGSKGAKGGGGGKRKSR